jgi:hypothetical protein
MIPHMSLLSPVKSAPVKKLAALLLLTLAACGKRGDPHPPVPVIPQATSDLVVAQRGAKVLLSWSYPSVTTAGKSLGGLRRVVLYRYVEPLPATQPPRDPAKDLLPGDIDPTIAQPQALFAKIPPLGPMQFNKLRERVDSIEAAALPAASSGTRLSYEDTPELRTLEGRPVRLNYAVVTEGNFAKSDLSNIAHIVPLDVPTPVAGVTATAKAEGVILSWDVPTKSIAGQSKPFVAGYNVYRTAAGEAVEDSAAPVNGTLITKPPYTDAPPYGNYDYRVTAVASSTPRIESDPSAPAKSAFKDLLPPPAVTGLTALVETKAVQLVWDAVESPDLAGYKVYRTEGSGIDVLKPAGTVPLTPQPITTTTFRDIIIDPGISYFYEVTAVDKSGNESPRAKTQWVLVPKTP